MPAAAANRYPMVAIMTVLPKSFASILARIIATGGRENKQLVVGCRGNVSPSRRLSC